MSTTTTEAASAEARRDALVERLFGDVLGFNEICLVYLGERLGLYRALGEHGAATSEELAERAEVDERYVREWLEHQAVAGILDVDDVTKASGERRYSLPAGHDEVLLERDSLNFLAPFVRMTVGMTRPLDQLVESFRGGAGVPYADYGADTREGIADMNRVFFINELGRTWFPAITDVHERLLADPPARVADVACGSGWSSISIARAYPKAQVDGLDLDDASIELARANAVRTDLADRVSFEVQDAADPKLAGRYDLVTIFEALHDMGRPVEALSAARALLTDGGSLIVMDERVADTFTAPGDEVEQLMYGWSVLHCLPVGLADHDESAGTGTVFRTDILRRYAADAGFTEVEVLPIENDFWRFYRLRP